MKSVKLHALTPRFIPFAVRAICSTWNNPNRPSIFDHYESRYGFYKKRAK